MSETAYHIISDLLDSKPAPHSGLLIDIVQHNKNTFSYRLYKDNLIQFSNEHQVDLFEWIKDRLEMARKLAVGCTIGLTVEQKHE